MRRQLSDAATHLYVQGIISSDSSPSLPNEPGNVYLNLLAEFPALKQVCSPDCLMKHDVTHHI